MRIVVEEIVEGTDLAKRLINKHQLMELYADLLPVSTCDDLWHVDPSTGVRRRLYVLDIQMAIIKAPFVERHAATDVVFASTASEVFAIIIVVDPELKTQLGLTASVYRAVIGDTDHGKG